VEKKEGKKKVTARALGLSLKPKNRKGEEMRRVKKMTGTYSPVQKEVQDWFSAINARKENRERTVR